MLGLQSSALLRMDLANKRPLQLVGTLPIPLDGEDYTLLYKATVRGEGGGLVRIEGRCGFDYDDDADFCFVYVPEMNDVIVYSNYRLEYIGTLEARREYCSNIAYSNPYYFGDIGEMMSMAPCIRTRQSRVNVYLRPLIRAILGSNPLHQLTLPIERFKYYRR
jgi:hypothetical protein